jgi:hypothetical protein
MSHIFTPSESNYKAAQKAQSLVPYFNVNTKITYVKTSIENCAVDFLITISHKRKNVSVNCIEEFSAPENSYKSITFNLSGFENMVNSLGGIEIETPYGLPSPYKNKTIIAKDEKLLVYGSSLGEILTKKTITTEMAEYYCYILEELCIKFLNDCTPESYTLLNQNCETNISYTDFYDNYKSLKNIER